MTNQKGEYREVWVSHSRVRLRSHINRIAYLFMVALSFYLILVSRSGETHNIWEAMHPALLPVFFVMTLLLVISIFSNEKAEYKLLFVILHSILTHSLTAIILPWGSIGDVRGSMEKSHRVFDGHNLHGIFGLVPGSFLYQIYIFCRGDQFQAALSVIFARMFGVDVSWATLLLVPLLWGIFVPLVAFLVAREIDKRENISVLSGLVASVFPALVIWGAVTAANSVGYLLFFCALYFLLKYLSSGEVRTFFWAMVFSVGSAFGHYMCGVVSLSLIPLVLALRTYQRLRHKASAKFVLLLATLVGASLFPFALILQPLFYPIRPSNFGLDNLSGLSTADVLWMALLGKLASFDVKTAILYGVGQILGFLGMINHLLRVKKRSDEREYLCKLFLLLGFVIILVNYRLLILFMVNVPFGEERLWAFGDFMAIPFVAIVVGETFGFLHKRVRKNMGSLSWSSIRAVLKANLRSIISIAIISLSLSSWVMASVYYAYPRGSAYLMTTWYELEAVDYIDSTTEGKYIVICDQWFIYAADTKLGLYNPNAFYFHRTHLHLNTLLNNMMKNPSTGPMIEAIEVYDMDVAYFVVEEPRVKGVGRFEEVVLRASLTLETYAILGEGKLYIFRYEKTD